ncbi:DUF6457 domain-containing protein [Corynebacterium sp. KPL2861]|uniref:DUF6457 domain-containing protein n=1 Tax=Corynebacterium sp. KPL2861 TaxID=3158319 RepID=UPI0032EEA95C
MSTENEDPIRTAHQWLEEAARLLNLEPHEATALTRELLDLTKDVAHTQLRPAAPLTAFVVGLASASTAEAKVNIETLKEALK